MCGILFVSRKDGKPAARQALKRYHKQSGRGTEGFGLVAFDGKIKSYKRFMFEPEMEAHVQTLTSKNILLHHRYPTSVLNLPETAHPIRVMHEELEHEYYVAHNGHISNHKTLKEAHEKLGYAYTTEVQTEYTTKKKKRWYGSVEYNDSEALAIELARTIEGKQSKVGAHGQIAYMVLQVKNKVPTALFYGTNGGNPLTMKVEDTFTAIASEGYTAIDDEKSYRLDLSTYAIDEVRIDMPSAYVPKTTHTTRGYDYSRGTGMGFIKSEPTTEEYMNAYDLENELVEVGEELMQCAEALQDAIESGNTDGELAWRDEYAQLDSRRKKLERELETSVVQGI